MELWYHLLSLLSISISVAQQLTLVSTFRDPTARKVDSLGIAQAFEPAAVFKGHPVTCRYDEITCSGLALR